jgi:hypothetical protein
VTRWQAFRTKLARERAAGVRFGVSWRRRVTYALPPASQPRAREADMVVLAATRDSWRRAHEGAAH